MRLPPPEVVATWPPPNYINPVTRGPTLIIVELITLAISLISLGLRLYVRIKLFGRIELDDWLMMGGAVRGWPLFLSRTGRLTDLIISRSLARGSPYASS